MTEEMHDVLIPMPVSLRDTIIKTMETKGVEVTNKRIINALKFAFTDNPIPFTDSPVDEPQWATKEDIEKLLDKLEEVSEYLHDRIVERFCL